MLTAIEKASITPARGRALLAELEEDLAQLAVVVGAGGHVALGSAHREASGARLAALREALADGGR
jgi:hypothetical protein